MRSMKKVGGGGKRAVIKDGKRKKLGDSGFGGMCVYGVLVRLNQEKFGFRCRECDACVARMFIVSHLAGGPIASMEARLSWTTQSM